ncbi:MAG: T9SS type A sorting domain-containing protein [Bacteroidia bacterium]|nr:T9SS type A sorting domain-containing protein [Bacteroidia bacterium]
MDLINKFKIIIVLCISSFHLYSQEIQIGELTTNQLLVQKYSAIKSSLKLGSITDTLNLGSNGILDDFSYAGPYPDTSIWLDNFVFVNNGFAKAPITVGVATFDGVNEKGYPYNFNAAMGSSGQADYLTSKPINLSYPASDSVYFSFYVQPQGRGNAPEQADSLVVEFRGKGPLASWNRVWAKRGSTLSLNDSSWTLVMIPIKDTNYLTNGFQFRFRNKATLNANADHWNIDYVYLNKIRNKNDTLFEDISFVYNHTSMLNAYTAMPWRHYATSNMKSNYATTLRNNHNVTKNASFTYRIFDANNLQISPTYSGGNDNIDPYITNGYSSSAPFINPPLSPFVLPVLTQKDSFYIQCAVNSTPDFNRKNDTIKYVQKFDSYYAYDDGSAEVSMGLNVLYGQLAYRFNTSIADTLRYVDIYFNPFEVNAELFTFKLKVWANAGNLPGISLFTSDSVLTPAYGDDLPNQFTRYRLSTPLYLPAGTYHIGFIQNTNQFLYVGLDRNINNQDKITYNVNSVWQFSPEAGSLMIRPVFGAALDFVGVNENNIDLNKLVVYPNPATNRLYFKTLKADLYLKGNYEIIDMLGRTIESNTLPTDGINISFLSQGFYFLKIVSENYSSTVKFAVSK